MDKAFNGTSAPRVRDLGDGTHALVVSLLGGDGGAGTGTTVDREYVVFDWTVKTAVTGAVVGDTLKQYVWYDASGSSLVKQFEQWTNKGVLLATAPTPANLEFKDVSTTGTTKTVSQVAYQVKTTFGTVAAGTYLNKVSVFDTSAVTSVTVYWFTAAGVAVGASDVALLVEGTNTIAQSEQVDTRMLDSAGALISSANPFPVSVTNADKFVNYMFSQSEEVGDTTFILKSDGTGWLMTKIVSTATTDVATYAGVGNNAAISLATAWSNRATLVYGSIAAV
jgi:hypothetical protein